MGSESVRRWDLGRFGGRKEDGWFVGVPFEFVGQVTGSSPMAKASDIKSCTTSTRHDDVEQQL